MHRFFVPPTSLKGGNLELGGGFSHQICTVLRMKPGDLIVVLDDTGWQYEIELVEATRRKVTGRIVNKSLADGEPEIKITLYQSLLKKDRFEWVLQKCTEVGVTEFVPVISSRTIPHKSKSSKLERWQKIITEAAEQSHRGRLPRLHQPLTFKQALEHSRQADVRLIPWEQEKVHDLHSTLKSLPNRHPANHPQSIAIFIGPEGGFEKDEIMYAHSRGIVPVTLGARILRAETAAVVAVAIVLYEFGET